MPRKSYAKFEMQSQALRSGSRPLRVRTTGMRPKTMRLGQHRACTERVGRGLAWGLVIW